MTPKERGEIRINQISLKIPAWFDDPNLWLKQVEAAFEITLPKITLQKTKYYHLLCLPPHAVTIVEDKLNPDIPELYSILVSAIRSRLTATRPTADDSLMKITLDNCRLFQVLKERRMLS